MQNLCFCSNGDILILCKLTHFTEVVYDNADLSKLIPNIKRKKKII